MKKIYTAVICGFLCLQIAIAQNGTTNKNIEWKNYTDSASAFSIQYPDNWVLKLTNERTVFVLKSPAEIEDDKFFENINLVVKKLPAETKISMEELARASIGGVEKKYPNFNLKHSKKVSWLKKDAWEIAYTITDNGTTAHLIQKLLIYNGSLFVSTYTAEAGKTDVYLKTAHEVFEKMTIK
ncbi:PsbP-related protein [Ferruginibacter sp.]|nr:DcrB-related protein [Ferruginibacter sp.]